MIRRLRQKKSPNERCTRGKQNGSPKWRDLTVNQRTTKGPALTRRPKRRIQPHANLRLLQQVQNLRTPMPLPQETVPLPQTSEPHPVTATAGTVSPAASTEPDAAVVAMEKVPNQAVWKLLPMGKPRAASRSRSKRRPAKAPKLDSSGGEGKAETPSHRAQRGGDKGNNRSRGRPPLSRRHLPPDQAQPCRSAAAHTSRRDSKGFAFGPPPDPPQPTLSPSRSGGNGAAGHTTKCSINAVIAHVVVTEEADVRDLVRMFSSTRASIVVVSYDKWNGKRSSAQEKMFEVFRRLCGGSTKWSALWMTPGVAFAKTARISTVVEKLSINSGTHIFTVVECQIRDSRLSASGSLTLVLVASASDAGPYPAPWLNMVCSAVAGN